MAKNTIAALAVLVCASFLTCSSLAIQTCGLAPTAPISMEAAGSNVNITGEVVGTDGYLIVSDFVATAVNSTGGRAQSDMFSTGRFAIELNVPGFAKDNETIDIRVLSPDGGTLYGNTSLRLANTNHTTVYAVEILVANPPPNYNGLLLVIFLLIFSLILAMYILFTKWLVGQAVLKRADEIMMKRGTDQGRADGAIDEEEAADITAEEEKADEPEQSDGDKS